MINLFHSIVHCLLNNYKVTEFLSHSFTLAVLCVCMYIYLVKVEKSYFLAITCDEQNQPPPVTVTSNYVLYVKLMKRQLFRVF